MTVRIALGSLASDNYQIIIRSIQDGHGNTIDPDNVKLNFTAAPEPGTGKHVEFPEYTARVERNKTEVFNPGDRVDTRMARLYYFRDAHRVAQIINRNVQSYNRAAVTMAQQNAEDSRNLANQKTADRKQREATAIRAAEATRAAESELAAARQALEEIRAVNAQATQGAAAATQAATDATRQQSTPEIEALTRQSTDLGTKITSLNTAIDADQTSLNTLNSTIAALNVDLAGLHAELDGVPAAMQNSDSAKALVTKTSDLNINTAKKKAIIDRMLLAKADLESTSTQKDKIDAKVNALKNENTDFTAQATALTTRATSARTAAVSFAAKVAELESKVANLRDSERLKQADVDQAQEAEDRARENQFRAEVAAATADPDTYVPGDVKSVDPVTRVSVSVIGEGLIQLRGPIRGINKIRTMISQIDAPVGQVKVGIFTVQVNGEHGDRMEKVATRIEGNIDLSRYLTNQSLGLLRRSIQEIAGMVVKSVDLEMRGNRQVDRDRRYLYAFFGRDFVDELYEMDSEFLHTENKILSIHSMDTTNQSQAFFIMALAKNDIRQMILERFRHLIQCEMPCLEWDFRRSADMTRRIKHQKLNTLEEVTFNVHQKYHFSNLHGFFNAWVDDTDAMTPMQREFIRLAQIFKSQMVAEMEYKQRVIERGLIEDQANTEDELNELLQPVRSSANLMIVKSLQGLIESQDKIAELELSILDLLGGLDEVQLDIAERVNTYQAVQSKVLSALQSRSRTYSRLSLALKASENRNITEPVLDRAILATSNDNELAMSILGAMRTLQKVKDAADAADADPTKPKTLTTETASEVKRSIDAFIELLKPLVVKKDLFPNAYSDKFETAYQQLSEFPVNTSTTNRLAEDMLGAALAYFDQPFFNGQTVIAVAQAYLGYADSLKPCITAYLRVVQDPKVTSNNVVRATGVLKNAVGRIYPADPTMRPPFVTTLLSNADALMLRLSGDEIRIARAKYVGRRVRQDIDHRKLLEFLTDEQEEKYIELEEGCRSHIAQIDNYLKRLAIALEDDFKVQFYDPAFAEVRRASREWDVNLGQVERTTILTNNRALAKVSPQATMEFDLPKRDIMITEAMTGAKAIVNEYGTLLQDPTFLSVTGMLSGSPAVGGVAGRGPIPGLPGQGLGAAGVRNVLPGQSTDATEQLMAQTGGPARQFGSEFEKLIPDPAVYKIETGTGFEVRPVIQPDGHSIIYDFDYMYTTNIREPVRPDEKHLGRVKRHFIHTEVQTSSFELREISRYQVALKVSRTSRGVPLMEDIPGVGVLFRPLPSAESSLQQNIILGQSTVYPTLFDLMGLRWSKYVVDLDHLGLRDLEHVVRGRNTTIHDFTFDEGSRRVDEFLDIETKDKQHVRSDLYRQQRQPSPYHPGGYQNTRLKDGSDPTGREYDRPDTRPEDFREPPYDNKYRVPVENLPTRGTRTETIEIRGGLEAPQIPNSGLSNPSLNSVPERVNIRPMSYEAPAPVKSDRGATKPNSKSTNAPPPPTKRPQLLRFPSMGVRKS
ncbi:MAG: hypothetical protein JSS49_07430 [Planctomycetes bacterium]|nr:hypothetical protein [Planctomycetota bacterium]